MTAAIAALKEQLHVEQAKLREIVEAEKPAIEAGRLAQIRVSDQDRIVSELRGGIALLEDTRNERRDVS